MDWRTANRKRRRLRIFLVHVLCTILFFCLVITGLTLSGAPKIQWEETVWRFGAVTNLLDLRHQFRVRNVGDQDLLISQVSSGCEACLQASITLRTIPPGQTADVDCLLRLRTLEGPVSRAVSVRCNDPEQDTWVLELIGEVIQLFSIAPLEPRVDVTDGADLSVVRILPITPLLSPLSQVRFFEPGFEGHVSPGPDGQYVLAIKPKPDLAKGRRFAEVALASTNSLDPVCRFRVLVTNPPDSELIPESVQLEATHEPQVKILWLRHRRGIPQALVDLQLPTSEFEAELVPESALGSYRIHLSVALNGDLRAARKPLLLKLKNPAGVERFLPIEVKIGQQSR